MFEPSRQISAAPQQTMEQANQWRILSTLLVTSYCFWLFFLINNFFSQPLWPDIAPHAKDFWKRPPPGLQLKR